MRAAPLALLVLAVTAVAPSSGAADQASTYQERGCPPQGAMSVSVRACEMQLLTALDGRGCAADPCVATLAASATVRGLPTPKDVAISVGAAPLCSGASTLAAAACDASLPLAIEAGCRSVVITGTGGATAPSGATLRAEVQMVHEYRACRSPTGIDVTLVSAR